MSIFKSILTSFLLSTLVSAHPQYLKRQSSIPFGQIINSCTVPGTVALSFDDGPYIYTEHVLDLLKAGGHHATFFLNGQNYGNIYDYSSTIQRMIAEGHQIGSHTWSHADLTTLDTAGMISEMTQVEVALLNILGYFPAYMRPPYLSTNATVLQVLQQLQYHVIQIDIDTEDWENLSPVLIVNSKNIYDQGIDNGGTLSLSHDPLNNTANYLVQQMMDYLTSKGLTSVPVGDCLGDASANWYRTTQISLSSTSSSAATTSSAAASSSVTASATGCAAANAPTGTIDPSGSCGGTSGFVCAAGSCCSQWGFCGTDTDFCGAGCQPLFGSCTSASCNSNSISSSIFSASSTAGISSASSSSVLASSSSLSTAGISSTSSSSVLASSSSLSTSSTRTSTSSRISSTSITPSSSRASSSTSVTPSSSRVSSVSISLSSSRASSSSHTSSASTIPSSSSSFKSSSTSSTKPSSTALPVSTAGQCGASTRGLAYTCNGYSKGTCCSVSGTCGSTSAYCGTGCQSAYGTCTSTVDPCPGIGLAKLACELVQLIHL